MDEDRAVAFGVELRLTPPADRRRRGPVSNPEDKLLAYRPEWGLSSGRLGGAPVLAFSRFAIVASETDYVVIVPTYPEGEPRWDYEGVPGATVPVYEGGRVRGHGTILWRAETRLPLPDDDQRRFLAWLKDPSSPLPEGS